jgi:hypothetical protein
VLAKESPVPAPSATTSLSNWDFHNHHVQTELIGGEFVSAESTLIAAGPPRLSDITGVDPASVGGGGTVTSGDLVYPIGVVENLGLSQSKQLQRLFEIGSSRSYFIPGRVIGSVTLGRVLYHGPSLLKVLYAHYKQSLGPLQFMDEPNPLLGDGSPNPNATLLDIRSVQSQLHRVTVNPGYDDLWLNLGSDIFNQPTGMCLYFRNQNDVTIGAVYLEECYVQGHQLSVSSGSVLIMEGASLQFDVLRPIRMQIPGANGSGQVFAN